MEEDAPVFLLVNRERRRAVLMSGAQSYVARARSLRVGKPSEHYFNRSLVCHHRTTTPPIKSPSTRSHPRFAAPRPRQTDPIPRRRSAAALRSLPPPSRRAAPTASTHPTADRRAMGLARNVCYSRSCCRCRLGGRLGGRPFFLVHAPSSTASDRSTPFRSRTRSIISPSSSISRRIQLLERCRRRATSSSAATSSGVSVCPTL